MATPPQEMRVLCGGGKGMNIFFNFRPIMMIQNENLLYNDERIHFLNHHTRARALARAQNR